MNPITRWWLNRKINRQEKAAAARAEETEATEERQAKLIETIRDVRVQLTDAGFRPIGYANTVDNGTYAITWFVAPDNRVVVARILLSGGLTLTYIQ